MALWQGQAQGRCGELVAINLVVTILGEPYEIANMFVGKKWQFRGAHQNIENHGLDRHLFRDRNRDDRKEGGLAYPAWEDVGRVPRGGNT